MLGAGKGREAGGGSNTPQEAEDAAPEPVPVFGLEHVPVAELVHAVDQEICLHAVDGCEEQCEANVA